MGPDCEVACHATYQPLTIYLSTRNHKKSREIMRNHEKSWEITKSAKPTNQPSSYTAHFIVASCLPGLTAFKLHLELMPPSDTARRIEGCWFTDLPWHECTATVDRYMDSRSPQKLKIPKNQYYTHGGISIPAKHQVLYFKCTGP